MDQPRRPGAGKSSSRTTPVRMPVKKSPPARKRIPLFVWIAGGALALVLIVGGVVAGILIGRSGGGTVPTPKEIADAKKAVEKPPVVSNKAPAIATKIPAKEIEYLADLKANDIELPKRERVPVFTVSDHDAESRTVFQGEVLEPTAMAKKDATGPEPSLRPWVQFLHGRGFGVFGVATTANASPPNKSLTFSRDGSTNSTVFRFDNNAVLPFAAPPGTIAKSQQKQDPAPSSEVLWNVNGMEVLERLDVVEGPPVDTKDGSRRFLNTVLVRYKMTNKDKRPRYAGMRMQIDTLIGSNDGVPFTVPGIPGLVNSGAFADFRTPKQVPAFVQALEFADLKKPGTVAQANLRIGGGIETPDRVLLTHWPGVTPAWEIPLEPLRSDSALVLYWQDKMIQPGKFREVGFEYGLGAISSEGGRLGITLGGDFRVGGYVTVSAYMQGPTPKQTLALTLPAGLERLDGAATQAVPPSKTTSIVTWRIQIKQNGLFELKVASNDGLEQTKQFTIGKIAATKSLDLAFAGPYEARKPFVVTAEIADPRPNDAVTIGFPAGISLVEGEKTRKLDPARDGQPATVQWKVMANAAGDYAFTIDSSSGASAQKTLRLQPQEKDPGTVAVTIVPLDLSAKAFTVAAQVYDPLPDQKVTLALPPAVQLIAGESIISVMPPEQGNVRVVRWTVRVEKDGAHLLKVQSSTGGEIRKTLRVDEPLEAIDRFALSLEGDWKPGSAGTLVASVTDAAKGQSLVLTLPPGLRLVDSPAEQVVPALAFPLPGLASKVTWNVRVERTGQFPVRVESSTGSAISAAIQVRAK